MRQIVLDTETTGIGHEHGHRVIEIGCVELFDRKLTGKHFHVYLNPQRQVDEGIDHFNRDLHGALLDAEILAYVYLAMTGGQTSLFAEVEETSIHTKTKVQEVAALNLINPIVLPANTEEIELHQDFVGFLSKKSGVNHWEEN